VDGGPDHREGGNDNPDYHAPTSPGNRPGAKILQLRNLPPEGGPLSFQIGE
jgi:hypothetical protein